MREEIQICCYSTAMASKLLLITVFVLDLIAFGLAVAAEQRRSTVTFLFPLLFFFFNIFCRLLLVASFFPVLYRLIYAFCVSLCVEVRVSLVNCGFGGSSFAENDPWFF